MAEQGKVSWGKKPGGIPSSWVILKNESQEEGGIILGVEVMLSRVANSRTCGTAHLGTL